MAAYLMLFTFTPRGLEKIKESPARVEAAKEAVRQRGGEVKAFYGILGSQYDTMFVIEAPNDGTVAAMALTIAAHGFVHTKTHRLFGEEEFKEILSSLP